MASRLQTIGLSVLMLVSSLAHGRELSWDALDIDASLDRDGRLHVVERHTMIFNGDWNGGERRFRVVGDQEFQFAALSEVDPTTGVRRSLHSGDLSAVGQYRFFDKNVLRWRARLPSDPPFKHERRIYEIAYDLSRIISKTDTGYSLNHDFAFPDRSGEIAKFTAVLRLDPAWRVSSDTVLQLQRDHLLPGQSAVLNVSLTYVGDPAPRELAQTWTEKSTNAITHSLDPNPAPWRLALVWTMFFFVVVRAALWYRHDRQCGKFAIVSDTIDRQWIQTNLLQYSAEFVGAAWDLKTTSNEVMAVIARMTQEGKLKSRIVNKKLLFWEQEVLELTLCRERSELKGYERDLVDKLFVRGGNTTDSEAVRDYYKSSGFDPAKLLKPLLMDRVTKLNENSSSVKPVGWVVTAGLLVGAAICTAASIASGNGDARIAIGVSIVFAGLLLIGTLSAINYRHAVDRVGGKTFTVVVCIALILIITLLSLIGSALQMPPPAAIAMVLATVGIVNSYFNRMQYRDSLDGLRVRKQFAAARRYFERELGASAPNIDDAWYPYVLAFGLGGNADRWFKSYGTARTPIADTDDSMPSHSSSTSSSSHSWSGGGGSFAGGGASGSWAAAIGGMAASVSPPSSSSSGGGSSGGGGSSSGGGGGGGW